MTVSFARRWALAASLALLGAPAAARAQETVLIYQRYTQVVTQAPRQPTKVDTASAEVLVVLGEQRLVVREPDHEFVYDFDQRRLRIVDAASSTFADWSLFGLVAFNDLELANRLGGRGRAPAGGASVRELEALFSMPAAVKPDPRESVVDSSRGNTVDVLINGRPFTHATFSTTPLPPSQAQTFARFLLYNFHLHPTARRAILERRKVPSTISFRTFDGSEQMVVTWRLVKTTTTPEVNDPMRGLARQDITDKEYAGLAARLQRCREMSADTSRARRTSQSQAFEAQAIQQGRFLDAGLARLSRDMEGCRAASLAEWPAELREKLASDSAFGACLAAADTLDAPRAQELLPRLARINQGTIAMGSVVGLLIGRAQLAAGETEDGTTRVLRALGPNPCAIGAWMDLGHAYFRTYQPVLAWLCFDAARQAAPAGCPRLESSARLEADLLRRRPEFFE